MGAPVNNGEKMKMKTFLVATNIVASRPPERRPAGMLPALPKYNELSYLHREYDLISIEAILTSLSFLPYVFLGKCFGVPWL